MDSLKNHTARQSETLARLDVQRPATELSPAKPELVNARISEESLLHEQVSSAEKPHVTAAPKYVTPSQGDRIVPDCASLRQQPDLENAPAGTALHSRNGNSSSLANYSAVSVSTTVEGQKTEQDRETRKNQAMHLVLSNAIDEGNLVLARKLLNQGAIPASNDLISEVYGRGLFLDNLIDADDVQTFHALISSLAPEINAEIMDNMLFPSLAQKKEKLSEYIARHSTIADSMIGLSTDDQSNKTFQALLDGGVRPKKEGFIQFIGINRSYPTNEERYASLPTTKSIAAQAFDAHRDGNYEEADRLFNPPAPTEINPLGLATNALAGVSKSGLAFLYERLQSSHAGLTSTMPDRLLTDGFRSEIVWILRSCHDECKAARGALMAQMNANEFRLAYKTEDGNVFPCNEKAVEQLLFALQLATHERLLQIAQPPLKEKEKTFQTIWSGMASFFNLDKNKKARTAQAEKIVELAQDVNGIILQLPQEILAIKTGVSEKRIPAETALASLQQHQERLEAQFEEVMSGILPGTALSEQLVIKIFGDAFKELAAIREAALGSAGAVQRQ